MLLPTQLKKQPLLEALCEFRTAAGAPLGLVVPGLLAAKWPSDISGLRDLPSIPLSDQLLEAQPTLAFVPQVELKFRGLIIRASARSITISNPKPYMGWARFKPILIDVANLLLNSKQFSRTTRYSLKYIDLLDTNTFDDPTNALTWSARIGNINTDRPATMLRTQVTSPDSTVSIITLTGAVKVQQDNQEPLHGALVDVDTICSHIPQDLDEFVKGLPKHLDRIHSINKELFFGCLTQDAINSLEPVYGRVRHDIQHEDRNR